MDRPQEWIERLSELRARKIPCALVVVTDVKGSGPREPGARMIVTRGPGGNGALEFGTVGGGNLEKQAIERSAALLRSGKAVSTSESFTLSEQAGQCCGGAVTLFFETFPWTRRKIAIFGAGHVAQAIAGLSGYLSADVVLIDGREESEIVPRLPETHPWKLVCVDHPEEEIATLSDDALLLVMTHSHVLDLEIVAKAIRRDFAYLGLIGSARKWDRFKKRLEQRGFTEQEIGKVRCPIGVSKHSKEPAAIAISVAAELLEVLQTEGEPTAGS